VQVIELNLATRPFKNDTLLWVGSIVAVALAGFVSWYNVNNWQQHRAWLSDVEERQVSLDQRFAELERRDDAALRRIDKVNLPALTTRASKANEVIRWKSFSWTRLFNQLQEVQPWNVQMTSIHPVFRGDARAARNDIEDLDQVPVSVEGTAKTLKDFLEFERALIFDPHFDRIDPGNIATDDNSRETIFRVRFLYDPRIEVAVEAPAEDEAEAEGAVPPDEGTRADAAATVAEAETGGDAAAPLESGRTAVLDEPVEPQEGGELTSGALETITRGGKKKKRGADQATAEASGGATAPVPVKEPDTDSAAEPATNPATEPAADGATEPAMDPAADPAMDPGGETATPDDAATSSAESPAGAEPARRPRARRGAGAANAADEDEEQRP
jgi:hypothetical protein